MNLLDAEKADTFYELTARVLISAAPNKQMATEARLIFESTLGWFYVARILAELSPSLLRKGDFSDWARFVTYHVLSFYQGLETPPKRLEKVEVLKPYVKL
jgi:hypothetical protein